MSLFADSNHITEADLLAVDPEVTQVVTAEEFTLSMLIGQAWGECADALQEATQSGYGYDADPVLAFHLGWTSGAVQLSRIVVTSEYANRLSPLKRWMVWKCLEVLYRAAANRRVSDRYDLKYGRAQGETTKAWRAVWAAGLPMVATPLPCPGALHELQAGTFGASNVASVAGGSDDAADYVVAITWLDADGVESGPSVSVPVTVAENNLLRVNITGLNPPGSITIARAGTYLMGTATHWNVYVDGYLQNTDPIAIGTATYTLAAAPTTSGALLGTGQVADGVQQFQRVVGRG